MILHLLHAGRYADRAVVGAYPTRAAAEAEIVRRAFDGTLDLLAEGAQIEPLGVDVPGHRAAVELAGLWATVAPAVRDGVDAECGGLAGLLDRLVGELDTEAGS
jgi:hypothetical protein